MSSFDSSFVIVLPAIVLIAIFLGLLRIGVSRQTAAVAKAVARFKIMTVATGVFTIVCWFLLPTTATLSTFGYPEAVHEIDSREEVLDYLQRYNKAIVRTVDLVSWFMFVFVWWFLSAAFALAKAYEEKMKGDAETLEKSCIDT